MVSPDANKSWRCSTKACRPMRHNERTVSCHGRSIVRGHYAAHTCHGMDSLAGMQFLDRWPTNLLLSWDELGLCAGERRDGGKVQ